MPVSIREQGDPDCLAITLTGTMDNEDSRSVITEIENSLARSDHLSLLLEMIDFDTVEADALWRSIEFEDAVHPGMIERIAVVGETQWQKWMATLEGTFTNAEIRYFDISNRDASEAWLRGHMTASSG